MKREKTLKLKKINVPKELIALTKILNCDIYLVGGYVRNSLLNLPIYDIDITSALTPEQVFDKLSETEFIVKLKSAKMGTVEIFSNQYVFQHTTFRKDSYKDDGSHCPTNTKFVNSVEEDATRRDFTINAIYYNVATNKIYDKYNGQADIKNKLLKCIETPEKVFSEDALRLLRLVRFASELNFSIEEQTKLSAIKFAHKLKAISGERKRKELEDFLMCNTKYNIPHSNPINAIKLLYDLNLMPYIFNIDNAEWKFIENDFKSILNVEDRKNRLYCFLINLYFALTKSHKLDFEYYTKIVCSKNALNFSNAESLEFKQLLKAFYYSDKSKNLRKFIFTNCNVIDLLLIMLEANGKIETKNKIEKELITMKKEQAPLSIKDLKINGNDLKSTLHLENREIGIVLKKLLKLCLFNPKLNNKECLLLKAKDIKNNELRI